MAFLVQKKKILRLPLEHNLGSAPCVHMRASVDRLVKIALMGLAA